MISRRALFTLDFERPRRAVDRLVRVHRTAMACRVEVALSEEDTRHVSAAAAALNEADRIEALLTVFRETSELSRVNRGGADGVEPELFTLLRRCAQLCRDTDGAFDITSTPLSRCWGFLKREGCVPPADAIEDARSRVGMHRVTLEGETRSVRFARPGMELNLNAMGKGYALDRMGRLLRHRGVAHALLSAGASSVLAVGGRSDGWPVDIRSTILGGRRLARVRLRNTALGTSGAGEQFVIADGTRYGHVIDPRSGWPARGVVSASVATAEASMADALSTAFLVGGPDLASTYCEQHPGTLALLTLDDERLRVIGACAGATVESSS